VATVWTGEISTATVDEVPVMTAGGKMMRVPTSRGTSSAQVTESELASRRGHDLADRMPMNQT